MIGKPLESVEDLAGDDLLPCAGDQPVIEKDGGTGIEKTADADLGFPKSGFKFLPFSSRRPLHRYLSQEGAEK